MTQKGKEKKVVAFSKDTNVGCVHFFSNNAKKGARFLATIGLGYSIFGCMNIDWFNENNEKRLFVGSTGNGVGGAGQPILVISTRKHLRSIVEASIRLLFIFNPKLHRKNNMPSGAEIQVHSNIS